MIEMPQFGIQKMVATQEPEESMDVLQLYQNNLISYSDAGLGDAVDPASSPPSIVISVPVI